MLLVTLRFSVCVCVRVCALVCLCVCVCVFVCVVVFLDEESMYVLYVKTGTLYFQQISDCTTHSFILFLQTILVSLI